VLTPPPKDGINKESPDIKRKRQEQPTHRSCPSIPDMKVCFLDLFYTCGPDQVTLRCVAPCHTRLSTQNPFCL